MQIIYLIEINMHNIDVIDKKILRLMQIDALLSVADIAEKVGVATASCWRRIGRMEKSGIIKGQISVIDPKALGLEVEVSLRITLDKTQTNAFDRFIEAARKVKEVNEIQTFLGRVDVRLNILARDMAHYQEIYRSQILLLPHISDIEALMVITNVMTKDGVPL
jgi:Lrp/AsnC family transcriptional regulator